MNMYDYIDQYGIYSFSEKEINEVDCVIFSFISYADFTSVFEDVDSLTIQEAARKHLGLYPNKDKNVIAVKEGNKLLRYMKDTIRYKDCKLFNYEYVVDNDIQFGVLSIEYLKNHVYVSYEGTNQEFSGWKENFMLSYQFPTASHNMAIEYLNNNYTFSIKSLIVGGHSKGGNLALVASMYSNYVVRKKIKQVYNVDGPGLLDKQFKSSRFEKIKKKYNHIIPDYSLVGLLLNHSNDKVVLSTNKGILAHNIVYWKIKKNTFERSNLSPMSKELDKEIMKWYRKYSSKDKEYFQIFIKNLDEVLTKANIRSILDLKKEKRRIFSLIHESKDINESTKKLLTDLIIILIKCFKDTKKEEIKQFVTNMFKIKGSKNKPEKEAI